jgi:hypothetical protein
MPQQSFYAHQPFLTFLEQNSNHLKPNHPSSQHLLQFAESIKQTSQTESVLRDSTLIQTKTFQNTWT